MTFVNWNKCSLILDMQAFGPFAHKQSDYRVAPIASKLSLIDVIKLMDYEFLMRFEVS